MNLVESNPGETFWIPRPRQVILDNFSFCNFKKLQSNFYMPPNCTIVSIPLKQRHETFFILK